MKDREFLLIVTLVTLTLIVTNFSLFVKSLASGSFLNPLIKQAAQQLKLEGARKKEQEFWSRLKEVDSDSLSAKIATINLQNYPNRKAQQLPSKPQPPKHKLTPKPSHHPSPAKIKLERPYTRFLFVGDSIMLDVGSQLQYQLRNNYKIADTKLDYKVSSGLNRIDYYDWYARTENLINSYKPDVLVVMFGGNDNQDITDFEGHYRVRLSNEWKTAYRERVEKYAKLVSASSVRKVYWIGQPISSRTRYNQAFSAFNTIYNEVSQSYPKIKFVSTWEKFSIAGRFTPVVADRSGRRASVKVSDAIHFTTHGAKIVSELVIARMVQDQILTSLEKPKTSVSQR